MGSSCWKGCFLAGALLALTSAVPAQDLQTETDQPFRADVNLVTLRFSVRDDAGHFLNTLRRADFQVSENGEPREILFFEAPQSVTQAPLALWLAFLIDVSGSTFATRAEEILAAQAFFENIHEFTQVGIFGFTDELLPFHAFSPDKEAALAAFGSARRHLGKTAIYSSLHTLIGQMSQAAGPEDRKVIIVVSDGMDDQFRRSAEIVSLARSRGVVLYTIWVPSAAQLYIGPSSSAPSLATPGPGADPSRLEKEAAFARLSMDTRGRHFGGFETILDFDNVLAEINEDIFGNLYSVGYDTPFPLLDRAQRNISVRLSRGNVQVHGLFKNVPDQIQAKKRFIAALFDNEAISELLLPSRVTFREIGAQMDLLRSRRDGASVSLPFRIKISPFSLQRGPRNSVRTQFGVIGLLVDSEGNEVVRLREIFRASLDAKELRTGTGVTYTNTLFAPPGNYQLRLAVLEIPTWKMTVFERSVRIN